MQYRNFGKLDWKPSALGVGCMRLPTKGNAADSSEIMEDEAVKMIHEAISCGVNYIDTAYMYHGGKSETLLAKALKGGYREKVKVVTKSPVMMINTGEEFDQYLEEQLKRLDVDIIDVYLFHALGRKRWEVVKEQDILHRAEMARKEGKIKHLGFSFHDEYAAFEEIVNEYDGWEVCMVQYNYADIMIQAGMKGVRLAAEKNIGVAVMEPLRGAMLTHPPAEVEKLFRESGYPGSFVDFALQWLWDQKEVGVVLSGMNNIRQIRENVKSAENSAVGRFGEKERLLAEQLRSIYQKRPGIPCTACGYCMPCPAGINIPTCLTLYSDGLVYNHFGESKRSTGFAMTAEQRAASCTGCKACDGKCPQKINISERMPEVQRALGLPS